VAARAKLRIVTARDELDQMIEPWEWTVSPDAGIDLGVVGVDRDDVMLKVLGALEADLRAHGVGGISYDEDRCRLGSTFQVHLDPARRPSITDAVEAGREILAAALMSAGVSVDVIAVTAVRGGDARKLP
jgi:hypothetical protein